MKHPFYTRHIGINAEDETRMLQKIGVESLDELIDKTLPADIRLQSPLDLPEAMMRLTANERVLINTLSGEYAKQKEEGEVASWRTGSLRFYRTPLFDVARELERRYHCRIVFADGVGSDNLISGQHDNKTLEAVLRSIEYASGIRYRAEGDSIVLYK